MWWMEKTDILFSESLLWLLICYMSHQPFLSFSVLEAINPINYFNFHWLSKCSRTLNQITSSLIKKLGPVVIKSYYSRVDAYKHNDLCPLVFRGFCFSKFIVFFYFVVTLQYLICAFCLAGWIYQCRRLYRIKSKAVRPAGNIDALADCEAGRHCGVQGKKKKKPSTTRKETMHLHFKTKQKNPCSLDLCLCQRDSKFCVFRAGELGYISKCCCVIWCQRGMYLHLI